MKPRHSSHHCRLSTHRCHPLAVVTNGSTPSDRDCCVTEIRLFVDVITKSLMCRAVISLGTLGAKTLSRKAPGFSSSPSSPSILELVWCFAVPATANLQLHETIRPWPLRSGHTIIAQKSIEKIAWELSRRLLQGSTLLVSRLLRSWCS